MRGLFLESILKSGTMPGSMDIKQGAAWQSIVLVTRAAGKVIICRDTSGGQFILLQKIIRIPLLPFKELFESIRVVAWPINLFQQLYQMVFTWTGSQRA